MANPSPSTCGEMLFIASCAVVLHSCLFEFVARIFSVCFKDTVWKVDRYLRSRSIIRQHSEPYKRVERTQLLYK